MAGEVLVTIIGNLTADPELKFLPDGAAVANFTIASTPRTFDRQTNEWKDGEALFLRSAIWREAAENVAQTLTRGARVIAQGFLKQRSYETNEGEKRTVIEFEVQEIGPSLKYATAQVNKVAKGQGGGIAQAGQQQGYGQPQQQRPQQGRDPWGSAPQSSGSYGGGQQGFPDPPF